MKENFLKKLFTRRSEASQNLTAICEALPDVAKISVEKDSIKIISFNTHDCECGRKIAEAVADIKRLSPDIVCLQELDMGVKRSRRRNIPRELAEKAEMPYYCFFPATELQGGRYGLGILSRFPLSEAECTPLFSGNLEKRTVGGAAVSINGKKINIFVTHLSLENREIRESQFKFLGDFLQDKEPFILCGDFNTESYGEFSAIRAECVNNEKNPAATYKGDDAEFKGIDNIFFSDSFSLKRSGIGKTSESDHDIIYAEFDIPQDNN